MLLSLLFSLSYTFPPPRVTPNRSPPRRPTELIQPSRFLPLPPILPPGHHERVTRLATARAHPVSPVCSPCLTSRHAGEGYERERVSHSLFLSSSHRTFSFSRALVSFTLIFRVSFVLPSCRRFESSLFLFTPSSVYLVCLSVSRPPHVAPYIFPSITDSVYRFHRIRKLVLASRLSTRAIRQ